MNRRQLKKIVYSLTEPQLNKLIRDHGSRGWVQASDIKEHGYGVGVLMTFGEKGEMKDASNC